MTRNPCLKFRIYLVARLVLPVKLKTCVSLTSVLSWKRIVKCSSFFLLAMLYLFVLWLWLWVLETHPLDQLECRYASAHASFWLSSAIARIAHVPRARSKHNAIKSIAIFRAAPFFSKRIVQKKANFGLWSNTREVNDVASWPPPFFVFLFDLLITPCGAQIRFFWTLQYYKCMDSSWLS